MRLNKKLFSKNSKVTYYNDVADECNYDSVFIVCNKNSVKKYLKYDNCIIFSEKKNNYFIVVIE